MNSPKMKRIIATFCLIFGLLFFFPFSSLASFLSKESTTPFHSFATETTFQLNSTPIVSGTYVGTAAITEPVQLGVLDLAFDLSDHVGVFSGTVNMTRTLAFSGALGLQGNLTGSIDGITPTFRLDSSVFNNLVSSRPITRQFSLTGEVWQNGQILQGLYVETITGLTPEPLTSRGLFMVARAPQPGDTVRSSTLQIQAEPFFVLINNNSSVTATLLDGDLHPIQNNVVTFSSDLGDVTPLQVDTDSHGVASATFTAGGTPGSATITATTGSLTGTAKVLITPPAVTTLTLTAANIHLPINGQSEITATLVDELGQSVVSATIEFSSTLGSVPISATTNASGVARATFTAGPLAGRANITATSSGLETNVDIGLENPEVDIISLEIGTDQILPGAQTSVTGTVIDQFGRPLAGQLVSFHSSIGTVSPSSSVTDNAGHISATFIAGTLFGEVDISALAGSISKSATILIRDPATAPTLTAVSPSIGPATGGTLVTLTGSNFQTSTSVFLDVTICQNITLVSSNEITCITPSHFATTVDVSVVNPDNQVDRILDGFTYE